LPVSIRDEDQQLLTRRPPTPLTIRISSGTGTGLTRLGAFDAAQRSAGVGNFNLVRLSSVIPPSATVLQVQGPEQVSGTHGDRLYCVYAEAYASSPLEQAWAGVAWSIRDDGSGEGLFVEHAASSEATVRHDLELSLSELSRGRGNSFVDTGSLVTSAVCVDHPVCAVVVATYRTSPWSDDGS
jgi:arginine decarboxylase